MEGKQVRSCSNCYWCHQCSEDEACEYYEPMEEEECDDVAEREEFYAEWNEYIKEDTI